MPQVSVTSAPSHNKQLSSAEFFSLQCFIVNELSPLNRHFVLPWSGFDSADFPINNHVFSQVAFKINSTKRLRMSELKVKKKSS